MPPPAASLDLAAALPLRAVDLAGVALVLAFLVLGARHGLWWQVVRLLGAIAAFSTARALAPRAASALARELPQIDPRVAAGAAWLLVVALSLLAVAFVGRIGKRGIDGAMLGGLDRAGGALAGALQGLCLWLALLFIGLHLAPRAWSRTTLAGSCTERVVAALAGGVPELFDPGTREVLAGRVRAGFRGGAGP